MRRKLHFWLLFILGSFNVTVFTEPLVQSNPFWIDFPSKEELTYEDYISAQEKLRAINVEDLIKELYVGKQGYSNLLDFLRRGYKGIRQTLIDPEKGFFPEKHLKKIGNGSDRCIVSCVPYNNEYPALIRSITEELEKADFNGYFLYRIGGFPNPTGSEIQYAGVPYSFKIFMMLEAQQLGFESVLWIDSAMIPLRSLEPIYQIIQQRGIFAHGWKASSEAWRFILPKTRQILKEQTGTDVLNSHYLCTLVFGMQMNTEMARKLIEEYYQMVALGLPFLSCFPEEFVLSAILGQPYYKKWQPVHYPNLVMNAGGKVDTPEIVELAKKDGWFFYQRWHNGIYEGMPKTDAN